VGVVGTFGIAGCVVVDDEEGVGWFVAVSLSLLRWLNFLKLHYYHLLVLFAAVDDVVVVVEVVYFLSLLFFGS
jgi:hypothetical protein